MAWLGKVSLGSFSNDIAGAVTKLSESVKSIEKNFDSALGLEASAPQDPVTTPEKQQASAVTSDPLPPEKQQASAVANDPLPPEKQQASAVANDPLPPEKQQPQDPVTNDPPPPENQENREEDDKPSDPRADGPPDGDCSPAPESQGAASQENENAAPQEPDTLETAEEQVVEDAGSGETHHNVNELQMMERALQGAAKQAQAKADEISRLLLENEQLKCALEEAKKKSSEVELNALREEYQHRLGAAERKVYALTKERDMLRREQNRKADSSALLKEKDEIIKQVMAEGEELSKKQAVQEAQIKKLRAQVRELEEEKQRLGTKLQVEEAKVESIRKDKAATEKVLQETVEKGHADLAAQREFYMKMVNEAREAEARAEARASSQAKADLDERLREAAERESTLVQALEELRQGLSRTEQQAAYREDQLRKDIEGLEKRCQDAESRYDDLVARVPESTRPLLRQIEAMQESSVMRAEAWTGVERALNLRLQEAEAKAAAAQERERATNERLSQTLSRLAIMEAQVSCVKAELAQVTRSLEKERARASDSRQEYLAALETAASHEARSKQLEQELHESKEKQLQMLEEEKVRRLAVEQDLEKERAARTEIEQRLQAVSSNVNTRRLPSLSMEEGHFLQASLDSSAGAQERYKFTEPLPPHVATMEQFEAAVRQKEGELASYASRLSVLEATRDSLAEELVRTTSLCEKLSSEAAALRGMRVEMEALRRRHASALELMGERDEQVEELRADLADVKQMYREQIEMLVMQIERLSSTNDIER